VVFANEPQLQLHSLCQGQAPDWDEHLCVCCISGNVTCCSRASQHAVCSMRSC
jgi:hypothetical protein